MTLDDKLKHWKEATEQLTPSAETTSALHSMVKETIVQPAAGSPATLPFKVKIILVVAAVGALAASVWYTNRFLQPSFRAKSVTVGKDPTRLEPCDELVRPVELVEPVENHRIVAAEMRSLVKTRPLTCDAQKHPLLELLRSDYISNSERERLVVRLLLLCGRKHISYWLAPLEKTSQPCDNSQWCHAPKCELEEDSCARTWANFDAQSCTSQGGKKQLLENACVRFLISQESDAEVRALSSTAWCLSPDARDEAKQLHSKLNTPKGTK